MTSSESIIRKTQNRSVLSNTEITSLVNDYTAGIITDELMIYWLQAVFKHGLTESETNAYTGALLHSGKQLDFTHLPGYVVDKHSTGGVGDKVSLILGPILAACDCYVPMLAGRGLAHTGGTIDKLESIPGYDCTISLDKFSRIVSQVGISIISQTAEICPADGKIYALRGVTGTVASHALICGSIMSKKIAEGIQGLVLDIKMGNGAFMTTLQDAQRLGELLSATGKAHGVRVSVTITDMNQPLGVNAGIWCEVQESIQSLKGNGPEDLTEVVFHLGKKALTMAGINNPLDRMKAAISSGKAYEIFEKMVKAHGGDVSTLTNIDLHTSMIKKDVVAEKSGFISYIDTTALGMGIVEMGGGRKILTDSIDPTVGFTCFAKLGQSVNTGDVILQVHCSSASKLNNAIQIMSSAIEITEKPPKLPPLIYQ